MKVKMWLSLLSTMLPCVRLVSRARAGLALTEGNWRRTMSAGRPASLTCRR